LIIKAKQQRKDLPLRNKLVARLPCGGEYGKVNGTKYESCSFCILGLHKIAKKRQCAKEESFFYNRFFLQHEFSAKQKMEMVGKPFFAEKASFWTIEKNQAWDQKNFTGGF
jgi:hypothetical protein